MSASPERTVTIACEGETSFGILHPAKGATGVVVIVGGPQYRVGSHRQFVQVARELAAAGHPVFRFDVRGMGDSTGDVLHTFEQVAPDIGAAIDALQSHQPHVQRIVLWGLCDAAAAALLYLNDRADPRVGGLCLANPWVRSPQGLAKTRVQHYYVKRLGQRDFWHKLLRGRVARGATAELIRNVALATTSRSAPSLSVAAFQERMLSAWQAFSGTTLVLLSGDDLTAQEFLRLAKGDARWRSVACSSRIQWEEIAGADHTFSREPGQRRATALTLDWLGTFHGETRPDACACRTIQSMEAP